MGRHAVLSIGTNSTRMLVADMRQPIPHVELARTVGTRVGEGLGESGKLGDDAMARTISVLREYANGARDRCEKVLVVATSALRRAENAQEFAQRVRTATGADMRILSGEEEAHASFRGAVGSLPPFQGRSGVVDIGGGSTEYAVGTSNDVASVHSYEIGAVRLTEQLPALSGRCGPVDGQSLADGVRIAAQALAQMHGEPHIDRLLFVGGSATTTAAVAGMSAERAPEITRTTLGSVLERLCALELEQRKSLPGMRPQRADILPAGIILLATAMEMVGKRSAVIAPGDLLLGVLLQEREREIVDWGAEEES
ncbi:MAG TPA: hypothetical protein VMV82_06280 [Candidatus Dormibacteraeota bacterium]|nr:hypothetical protein [Candidatus Dormibacteraeota bacterium]